MTVEIKIDTREPVLQKLLQSYYENIENDSIKSAIQLQIAPLDVGDVQIMFGFTTIIFERKSCSDLAASLKDNRYKEQKIRILSKSLPQHVIYILEGTPTYQTLLNSDFPVHGLKPSVISGMMIYTMLRDGIHVMNVRDTNETSAVIWTTALKCISNPEKIQVEPSLSDQQEGGGDGVGSGGVSDYLQHVKVKKIDNITPSHCYIMQLCQIPNISIATAREIVKVYPTMLSLLTTLSNLSHVDDQIKLLSDIPMIGKKKALTLLQFLLPV